MKQKLRKTNAANPITKPEPAGHWTNIYLTELQASTSLYYWKQYILFCRLKLSREEIMLPNLSNNEMKIWHFFYMI